MPGRIAAVAAVVGVSLIFASCTHARRSNVPTAPLASSPGAAEAFGRVYEAWEQKRVSEVALTDFLARYPHDGAASLVQLYLAYTKWQRGDLPGGNAVLAASADAREGAARDLLTVLRGKSLRAQGAPRAALETLRPLVGKVIDEADREIFLEELALSAVAARDHYEALTYLDAWLRGVSERDHAAVRFKIEQTIAAFPRDVLTQTYQSIRQRGAASGYSAETEQLLAHRLALVAVAENDPGLARWLLEVSGKSATQAGGEAALDLAELATNRRGLQSVSGRTLGLLLPTRTRDLQDEAADVTRGVAFALGLPRRPHEDGVRLVTRDDPGDAAGMRASLDELAGEGAALVIAGFDGASAERAGLWAEATHVPLILLAAPRAAGGGGKAYIFGERLERQINVLSEAMASRGAVRVARVVDSDDDEEATRGAAKSGLDLLAPVSCDVPLAVAGQTRFPVESWLRSGAAGWILSGPPACARDVLADLRRSVKHKPGDVRLPFAVTLEAGVSPAEVSEGIVLLALAAGLTPVMETNPERVTDDDVRAYMDRFGARPTYWTAIGRDAATLARVALDSLPRDTTDDPSAVAARRARVQAGMSTARARLWTSERAGFEGEHVLPRTLRLISWPEPRGPSRGKAGKAGKAREE